MKKWQDISPILLYSPLIPHILKLCIFYRCSPAIISKSNPLFPYGGLPFASKYKMQEAFDKILPATLIDSNKSLETRYNDALSFIDAQGFPVVLKPDTGHRGIGIHLIHNATELLDYLTRQQWHFQLQKYCELPTEFGVFYIRSPKAEKGQIVSLTQKEIPYIIGDGEKTILALINEKKSPYSHHYKTYLHRRKNEVLSKDELLPLILTASHSKGAIFHDMTSQISEKLNDTFNVLCAEKAFYFGRFDIKAQSYEDLENGIFDIIEVNGATSEMIHILDEKTKYQDGIGQLKNQWDLLFQISNQLKDVPQPLSFIQFLKEYLLFFKSSKQATGSYW